MVRKSDLLSESNNVVLGWFCKIGSAGLIDRLRFLEVCGFYLQTRLGTKSLYSNRFKKVMNSSLGFCLI